jgi:hypothetical protein
LTARVKQRRARGRRMTSVMPGQPSEPSQPTAPSQPAEPSQPSLGRLLRIRPLRLRLTSRGVARLRVQCPTAAQDRCVSTLRGGGARRSAPRSAMPWFGRAHRGSDAAAWRARSVLGAPLSACMRASRRPTPTRSRRTTSRRLPQHERRSHRSCIPEQQRCRHCPLPCARAADGLLLVFDPRWNCGPVASAATRRKR